jgi:prophage regulatory protein
VNTPEPEVDRLLAIAEVSKSLGLSQSQIYALVRERDFPSPIRIGRSSRWRTSTVNAWIDAKEQASA